MLPGERYQRRLNSGLDLQILRVFVDMYCLVVLNMSTNPPMPTLRYESRNSGLSQSHTFNLEIA